MVIDLNQVTNSIGSERLSSIDKNYINVNNGMKNYLSKLSDGDRLNYLMQSSESKDSCDICGNNLTIIKALDKKICLECEKNKHYKEVESMEDNWSLEAVESIAWKYFDNFSVIKNLGIKSAGFNNYDTKEEQVLKAKNIAKQFIGNAVKGIPKHMILSGEPGRGKSHLAMATLRNILAASKYTKKGIYVHYASYLELVQDSWDQKELSPRVKGVKKAIIEADIVVLDDLGVDLGNVDNPKEAGDWQMKELNLILEAREEKSLIITTNFDEATLKHAYGTRNKSRLFAKSNGFRVVFKDVTDKRRD